MNPFNPFNESFTTIRPEQIPDNFFRLINRDWMLITAGKINDYNTMTASWGTTGILWNKPIAICFIRPQRYTLQFAMKYDYFTLSFFPEQYHKILDFCGTHSGRTTDKVKETGLIPVETDRGNITFDQARLVIECKKLYSDFIHPEGFLESDLNSRIYKEKDYHRFFIGQIEHCYQKKTELGS